MVARIRRNALGSGDLTPARMRFLDVVIAPLVQVHGELHGAWIIPRGKLSDGEVGADLMVEGVRVRAVIRVDGAA